MRSIRVFHPTLHATILLVAAALLAWASPAAAFSRGGHGGAAMVLKHAAELQLTADQIQRIEALDRELRESMSDEREAVKSRHEALRALLSADPIDRAASEREADALAEAMTALHRSRLQARIDLAEILTPDQREALSDLRKQKRAHWRKH